MSEQQEKPKLTPKQLLFVGYYLESGNATEAARKAGYSESSARNQGSRMMKNDDILAEIERRMPSIMPKPEILARLADIGRNSHMGHFLNVGEEEVLIEFDVSIEEVPQDPEEAADEKNTKLIKRTVTSVRAMRPVVMLDLRKAQAAGVLHHIKKYSSGRDGERIELHDAKDALVQLGKFHGMWVEKQQVENWDMSGFTLPELDRIAAGESPADVIKDRGKA